MPLPNKKTLRNVLEQEKISDLTMDDLVFENRNKAYGAYLLRKTYNSHLTKGFLLALFITLFLNLIPFILVHMSAWLMGPPQYAEVKMEEPADLPLPPSIEVKLAGYEKPIVQENLVQKTVVPDFTKISNKPQAQDTAHVKLGMENKAGSEKAGGFEGENGYAVSEINPSFPGGKERMDAFIRANVMYPREEVERRKQGKVLVSFVVTEEGYLQDIKVIQGVSELLDAEALRVINMMPPWNPGFQKGKPVRVPVKVPIAFKLNY